MKDNHFISASAGTGKTYALTTRIIRLLLLGIDPASVAALTFTRAAAGEIFNKLAGRLAAGAADNGNAAEKLSREIFTSLPKWQDDIIRKNHGAPLAPAVFAETLRKLVATQHQSFIGTLDSFMWRMVRIFPLELGFTAAELRLMDAHESEQAGAAAVAQILNATPRDADEFFEDFRAATQGDGGKTFFGELAEFVKRWHRHRLDFPNEPSWGDACAIWGAAGMPFAKNADAIAAFETAVANAPEFADRRESFLSVCKFAREFNGTFDAPTPLKNMLENWTPAGAIGEFNCDRKKTNFSSKQQAAGHALLSHLLATALEIRLKHTAGLFRLMTRYEAAYAGTARDHGRLVFDDIPRKLATLGDTERDLLAFRLDSQIRHWLLDEFQDTSRAQWNEKVNRPLVREALQENEDNDKNWRSVFVVGDAKQSIYGWRGGDVAIFNEEKERPEYTRGSLTESYRFGETIVETVNTVFTPTAIQAYLAGGDAAAGAAERWGKIWEEHSAAPKKDGTPGDSGQVVLTTFQKDAASERDEIDVCADNIIAELDRTKPWDKNLEDGTAILVRTNDEGKKLAEKLSARGIRVAWEGESAIGDCPVVAALLNLVRLSAHPSDKFAKRHLAATPLVKAEAGAAAIAEEFSLNNARLGLAGALRKIIEENSGSFVAMAGAADKFTRARLDALLLAAAQFEAGAGADTHPDDFAAFVEASRRRDFADPTVVKILTVHRSKGLGFDYVIVPFFEDEGIDSVSNPKSPIIADDWILENPGKNVTGADSVLGSADDNMRRGKILENLCLYYVAMTRAKKYLSIHAKNAMNKDGKVSGTKYFSTHLINRLGGIASAELTVFTGTGKTETPANEKNAGDAEKIELPAVPKRKTPSATAKFFTREIFFDGTEKKNAGAAENVSAETGAERGDRLHKELQKIEWFTTTGIMGATGTGPSSTSAAGLGACAFSEEILKLFAKETEFSRAFEKPDDAAGEVVLWREKSFEVFIPVDENAGEKKSAGEWLSGRFDRVVFTGSYSARRAVIFDFKTNAKLEGEGDAAFAKRMVEHYAPQMALYRKAVQALCGLGADAVSSVLLLTETAAVVPVPAA
ncbi:UvrD-helicase domain-containing protein [Termitidicoccus mucosus]|uniref:DNA 3'-5' helicase n=1 Tax=Termitidicoccus mucosus TaxID=1184151 RepID=A0A178IB82_9BACT|nr:hypothetical protein AW736_24790 [Opitutaceae bacterium TSB47]